jgi:hypothetical protein
MLHWGCPLLAVVAENAPSIVVIAVVLVLVMAIIMSVVAAIIALIVATIILRSLRLSSWRSLRW